MFWCENRGKWKGQQLPGIEPRTPGLCSQCSVTEPRQLDNHQPSYLENHSAWVLSWWRGFCGQPLTEFWRHILSGCQVWDWGISVFQTAEGDVSALMICYLDDKNKVQYWLAARPSHCAWVWLHQTKIQVCIVQGTIFDYEYWYRYAVGSQKVYSEQITCGVGPQTSSSVYISLPVLHQVTSSIFRKCRGIGRTFEAVWL